MVQTTVSAPQNIDFYYPDRDTYAFSWQILPGDEDILAGYSCELQTDTVNTFDSVNFKSYNSLSEDVLNWQVGNFFQGVSFQNKVLVEDLDLYVRVRVNSSTYISAFTEPINITLKAKTYFADTELLFELLPDKNVYTKTGLVLTKKMIELQARQYADFYGEIQRVKDNINFYRIQDGDLEGILGYYMQYYRIDSEYFIVYRRELLSIWECMRKGMTELAMTQIVQTFFGTTPDIVYGEKDYGWIVHSGWGYPADIQDPNPDPTPVPPLLPTPSPMMYKDPTQHFILGTNENYDNGYCARLNNGDERPFIWQLVVWNYFDIEIPPFFVNLINKLKPINTIVQIIVMQRNGDKGIWGTDAFGWGSSIDYTWGRGNDDFVAQYL